MKWYCLCVTPQREFLTAQILTEVGLKSFIPIELKHLKQRKRSGKRKDVVRAYPLLGPRYVFCGAQDKYPADTLRKVHLVTGHVTREGEPAVFDEKTMDGLARISKSQDNIPISQAIRHRAFRAGDIALLIEGPFAGCRVRIVDIRGGKVLVFIRVLGGSLSVWISMDWIEHD